MMTGGIQPSRNNRFEGLGGDARMSGHHNAGQFFQLSLFQIVEIVLKDSFKRLLLFPLRMIGGYLPPAIERKKELKIKQLFCPKCAVVIKSGDAVFRFQLTGICRVIGCLYKVDDRLASGPSLQKGSGSAIVSATVASVSCVEGLWRQPVKSRNPNRRARRYGEVIK